MVCQCVLCVCVSVLGSGNLVEQKSVLDCRRIWRNFSQNKRSTTVLCVCVRVWRVRECVVLCCVCVFVVCCVCDYELFVAARKHTNNTHTHTHTHLRASSHKHEDNNL